VRRAGATRSMIAAGAGMLLWASTVSGQNTTVAELIGTGAYEAAIDALESGIRTDPTASAYRLLARTLRDVGRYDDALEILERAPDTFADELANVHGELLATVGQNDQARAQWNRAIASGSLERHVARLNRAISEYTYGSRENALSELDSFIDLYNDADQLPLRDLMAVGVAVRYLGVTNTDLYADAIKAFEEAIELGGEVPEPRVRMAELFLQTHASPDAHELLQQVLRRNGKHAEALLARAQALRFDGAMGVMEAVNLSLESNPNLMPAHVLKARLHLAAEAYDAANTEIDRALEINPVSLEALSVRGAIHFLRGEPDRYDAVRARVAELAPEYPDLYNDIADLVGNQRRYREASELAQQAVDIDSRSWRGYTLLGMNQLRLGKIEEGTASLETAFEGDPFNPWVRNTLVLIDSFENFEVIPSERFEFFLHSEEAELLLPYVEAIADEAFDALRERYDYTPPLPIRIEIYPDDGDFSVRTVGLAGIGALGVSFGSVIAMDSPSAKPLGSFNWASTLWHEMAHVFHLGMTEHEVPRWFSEGLAVHEQHAARPGWGHHPGPGLLSRFREGKFLPASQLNAGFVRPSYPEQVIDSYFFASIVFEFIENRWGFDAIVGMLHGFRQGETTGQQIKERLGLSTDDFDAAFDEYFKTKYATALASLAPVHEDPPAGLRAQPERLTAAQNPDNFLARLGAGLELLDEEDLDGAEEHFRAALRLFPEYGGADSPYWFLAEIHEQRGEFQLAARALARLNALNESNYAALMKQADLLTELDDLEGAAQALDGAVLIYPYEFEVHERLAELRDELGQYDGTVRERRAILALDPVDRAEAYYRLALAQRSAGDDRGARKSVISALEIAPSFDAALDLLLELRRGTSPSTGAGGT
jgi:tetratricopeptide (TPR) repeat protein